MRRGGGGGGGGGTKPRTAGTGGEVWARLWEKLCDKASWCGSAAGGGGGSDLILARGLCFVWGGDALWDVSPLNRAGRVS